MILCHAIQQIGIGAACGLCFAVSVVVSTVFKWIWASVVVLRDATGVIGGWSFVQLALSIASLPVLFVGAMLMIVTSVLLERSTRALRLEFEMGIRQDVVLDRERFQTKDNRANMEKLQEKVTPERLVVQHTSGLVTACISGAFFPWIQFSAAVPVDMVESFVSGAGINLFQAEMVLYGISLPISSVISLAICLALLLFNKSIKKYALCSGGFVALDKCTNFKGWRLVAAIVSSLMGVAVYCSFLLLAAGEWLLLSDRAATLNQRSVNFHFALWCISALSIGSISGVILQVANRQMLRATRLPERIMGPIAIVVIVAGLAVVGAATFPTSTITM